MSVDDTLRIGRDLVDITKPCDVAKALRKMQLTLASGGARQTVRIDGEEVTFQRSDDGRLAQLIAQYDAECARLTGAGASKRTRYAKRFRFT